MMMMTCCRRPSTMVMVALLLCSFTALVAVDAVDSSTWLKSRLRYQHRLYRSLVNPAHQTPNYRPMTSFEAWAHSGVFDGEDPFEHVRSVIDHLAPPPTSLHNNNNHNNINNDDDGDDISFLQVEATTQAEAGRVRSFCEICILVMQMKQRGQPHLCAGLNALHYVTCIENLESLLRADKALVYWLKNGCMHMDSTGPEIVRPCPALSICSWVPNLFAQPPSLVRDGVESLCPKDPKFLPTIPNEYKTLLQPQTAAVPGPGASR